MTIQSLKREVPHFRTYQLQNVSKRCSAYVTKLTPTLFFDSISHEAQDLRTSGKNLVQMNARIIDLHGLKASKELQMFWTDRVNHLSINLCKVLIVVQSISIQICICFTFNFTLSEDDFERGRNIGAFVILTYFVLFHWL